MINYNGYYITEPKSADDTRYFPKNTYFYVSAYLFSKDGEVKISSKSGCKKKLKPFTISDFKSNTLIKRKFEVIEGKIKLLPRFRYAKVGYLEIVNSNKLHNPKNDTYLKFIPWDNIPNEIEFPTKRNGTSKDKK